MEATNLESFLQWGQQPEAEFPEFQYLHSDYDNGFSWDECLEEYLEPFALGDLPPVTERAETILGIDDVPELTREPTASDREVHNLSQSLVELQERVDSLENKYEPQRYSLVLTNYD